MSNSFTLHEMSTDNTKLMEASESHSATAPIQNPAQLVAGKQNKPDGSNLTTQAKYNKKQWTDAERILPPQDLAVIDCLKALGSGDKKFTEINSSLKVCGEKAYISTVRKVLEEDGLVKPLLASDKKVADTEEKRVKLTPEERKKKKEEMAANPVDKKVKKEKVDKKKVPLKKALPNPKKETPEEIKDRNQNEIISEKLKSILEPIKKLKNTKAGYNSMFAELKLITFMYDSHIKFTTENIDPKNSEEFYELVIGMQKALHAAKQVDNISKTALNDLEAYIATICKKINFRPETHLKRFPRLAYATQYDSVFPMMSVKPYPSQVELVEKIDQEESLVFYKAMLASGKTTSIVALTSYVMKLNAQMKANGKEGRYQVIFCCSIEPVRNQVARLAYNAKVPFGLGNKIEVLEKTGPNVGKKKYNTDGTPMYDVKVIDNFAFKKMGERVLIIADLESTLELVKKDDKYVLFIDEPTVCADKPNHPVTNILTEIMAHAPKKTVLSSATLPLPQHIKPLVDLFRARHKNAKVETICTNEARIGCRIFTSKGAILTPHSNCQTTDELKKVMEIITVNPFLGRLYTATTLYDIVNMAKKIELKKDEKDSKQSPNENISKEGSKTKLPNLDEIFGDVTKLSQNTIQRISRDLMQFIIDNDTKENELLKKMCVSEKTADFEEIQPSKLLTTQATRFKGGCLISVKDPVAYGQKLADEYLLVEVPKTKEEQVLDAMAEAVILKYDATSLIPPVLPKDDDKKAVTEMVMSTIAEFNEETKKYNSSVAAVKELKVSEKEKEKKVRDIVRTKPVLKFEAKPKMAKISVSKCIEKYHSAMDKYNAAVEKVKTSVHDEDEQIKSLNELAENAPKLDFPAYKKINTKEHHAFYHGMQFDDAKVDNLRIGAILEKMDLDMNIPDWCYGLLFAGIGIYSNRSVEEFGEKYTKCILDLAALGLLAVLISDDRICYGADFPLNNVLISDELADEHSILSIYQLMARAGRAGKSWSANIYLLGKNTEDRIRSHFKGNMDGDAALEAINVNKSVQQYLARKADEKEKSMVKKVPLTGQTSSITVAIRSTEENSELEAAAYPKLDTKKDSKDEDEYGTADGDGWEEQTGRRSNHSSDGGRNNRRYNNQNNGGYNGSYNNQNNGGYNGNRQGSYNENRNYSNNRNNNGYNNGVSSGSTVEEPPTKPEEARYVPPSMRASKK